MWDFEVVWSNFSLHAAPLTNNNQAQYSNNASGNVTGDEGVSPVMLMLGRA